MSPAKRNHRAKHLHPSPMVTALYLTAEEKKMFDGLPQKLREGWTVELETGTFQDDEDHMRMRQQMARFHDPELRRLQKKIMDKSEKEIADVIREVDLSNLSDDDLSQMYFVLGPQVLGSVIRVLLADVSSDDALEGLASLTNVRHLLFESVPVALS
jgi:hypothetical protein